MVGRKGQGVCSCIVFPAAGEKARAAPGRHRRRGRRGSSPAPPTNRFLQRGGPDPRASGLPENGRLGRRWRRQFRCRRCCIAAPAGGGEDWWAWRKRWIGAWTWWQLPPFAPVWRRSFEPTKGPGPPGSRRHRRPGKRPNDGVFSGAPAPEAFGAAPEREFVGQNNRNIGSCRFSFQKQFQLGPGPGQPGADRAGGQAQNGCHFFCRVSLVVVKVQSGPVFGR